MALLDRIKEVIRANGAAMTVPDIYDAIMAADPRYQLFGLKPKHYLATFMQRHCLGVEVPRANRTKHFKLVDETRYNLLATPVTVEVPVGLFDQLKQLHRDYQAELKSYILHQLRGLEPITFERFSRRLLQTYGFSDLVVTPPSRDGGVDGYGKLKVGVAHLNVAFQCKRWNRNAVGRPDIDQFRGAIQGRFEQGLLLTTGSFASGAEEASFRPGAVPIILIDGTTIVDMMIEKGFGVQSESLTVYSYALDLALLDEE